MKVAVFETTLRDGLQGEGMHLSVEDRLSITELLDDLGVAYIEGGMPGSNPSDKAYFERAAKLKLVNAKLVAFCSTRRPGMRCEDDPNLGAVLKANTSVVTLFGKSCRLQVDRVLRISPEENLELIEDSVRYLKSHVDEVIFDAEHFFDGFTDNSDYALAALKAAQAGGADYVVLCDTNGGTLTHDLARIVKQAAGVIKRPLGIHTHNDSDLAVANTIAAVSAGVRLVQGTINGYGERCGNANLASIIPTLELKMGIRCLPRHKLNLLTHVSHSIAEIANLLPSPSQPYVGRSAFAHKGGMHANAVMKDRRTYEHIEPEKVGNRHRILISDLSGRASVCFQAREFGIELKPDDPAIDHILARLKHLENQGYQFEGADASFKLMVDEAKGRRPKYFVLRDLDVRVDIGNEGEREELSHDLSCRTTARIKLEVGGVVAETCAVGNGPVHAIDDALRKLIDKFYPSLKKVKLLDYKVRVLSSESGTEAVVRVLIRSGDCKGDWGTVGVSKNIIEASWQAMVDAIEYQLIRDEVEPHL